MYDYTTYDATPYPEHATLLNQHGTGDTRFAKYDRFQFKMCQIAQAPNFVIDRKGSVFDFDTGERIQPEDSRHIILNNTTMRNMQGFSISYFLYAFIPFGIYAIYYLVLYLINPYKKVPAKYAPRIMFLISVIVTVQLLLITYCVNLQLGFYSFTQAYYNHLFWIIPGIISFAPIFSNIIFVSLFYSKNFNV